MCITTDDGTVMEGDGTSIGWEVYNSTVLPVSFLLKWEQTAASHSHRQSFCPGQIISNCKSKPLLSCRVLSHSNKVCLTQYCPLPPCNRALYLAVSSPTLLLSIHEGTHLLPRVSPAQKWCTDLPFLLEESGVKQQLSTANPLYKFLLWDVQ